jgi:Tfp pilus assembly protein PilN
VLVGLSRRYVEPVELTLPPASDTELPQLVRVQTLRELGTLDDHAAIDFLALDEGAGHARRVTAVALPSPAWEQVRSICTQAGLTPTRLVFRPFASVAVCERSAAPATGPQLVVTPYAGEIDIAVLVQGRMVYWRTVRLADGGPERYVERVVSETCRTAASALHQLPEDSDFERVVVFASAEEAQPLVAELQRSFAGEVVAIDPLACLDPLAGLDGVSPYDSSGAGRFAPLVGMVLRHTAGARQPVDLLHPRQPPPPVNRKRRWATAAAAVGVVAMLIGYSAWSRFEEGEETARQLTQRRNELDKLLDRSAKSRQTAQAVEQWLATDVCWLDELRTLSSRFPAAGDMFVTRLSIAQGRDGGGVVDLQGVARSAGSVRAMEQNLRPSFAEIRSRNIHQRDAEPSFGWHFESTLIVPERDSGDRTNRPPPAAEKLGR